jgi:small-conductance mechanosensitive channel
MEQISKIFSYPLFSFNEQSFTLGQTLLVPIFFFLAYALIKKSCNFFINRLKSRKLDPDLVLLFQRLYFIISLLLLIFTSLAILNVPLGAFAFVSGAVAIGFGFGAQNIINNFISGWILIWEKPIRIGDFLEINDVKGTVETINTRSTRIRRTDGVHLLIPNSQLLENMVVNWTLVDDLVRGQVRVGVAYGSQVKLVSKLIHQAALEHESVLKNPEPLVIFEDFGDNALIFDLYFWINTAGEKDLRVICSDLRFKMEELFGENGIAIPFPQRDIHLDGELKLTR